MEIEAEAHEPALGRRDERALAARRVLEQMLALDDGAQRGSRLDAGTRRRRSAPPDRRVRRSPRTPRRSGAPAPSGAASRRAETAASADASVAFASARIRRLGPAVAAERDDALEPVRCPRPQRHVREHVEPEQEPELQLDRDERGKLEQTWVPHDLAEQDVPGGGEGQRARFGDRRAGAAHVGFVELEGGAQLDDGCGRVPDRREAVADLVVGVAGVNAARVDEDGLEHGPDLVRAAFEEVRVQPLEALLGPAIARGAPRAASGGGVPALPDPMCVPASVMRELRASSSWVPARMQLSCAHSASPLASSALGRWRRSGERARRGVARRRGAAPRSRSSDRTRARPTGSFRPCPRR